MQLLIQFTFGSMWASIVGYPLFWMVMTAAALLIIIESVWAYRDGNTDARRGRILGAGIAALLAGSLVFPYEALQGIRAIQIAEEGGASLSIVLGGFYLPFYPFGYGLLWFFAGLGMWKILAGRADRQM